MELFYNKKNAFLIDLGVNYLGDIEGLTSIGHFPTGALSIASYLEAQGIKIKLISFDSLIMLKQVFIERKDLQIFIFNYLNKEIHKHSPKVIGISISYTIQCNFAYEVSQIIKKIDNTITVVAGGPHVSFLDKHTLSECKDIDVIIRGEGEWACLELFSTILKKRDISNIAGITYQENNTIIQTQNRIFGDLSKLPKINFGLLPSKFYKDRIVNIVPTRGCLYNCKFCVERKLWGNHLRTFPIEKIIAEAKEIFTKYKIKILSLEDSMITIKNNYFANLINRLKTIPNRKLGTVLARVDNVNKNILTLLKNVGFRLVYYGFESGSQKVLNLMGKSITVDKMREACAMTKQAGLQTGAFWLVGYPGETIIEGNKTKDVLISLYKDKLLDRSRIYRFLPYPGTDFYSHPDKYDLTIFHTHWEDWVRRSRKCVCEQKDFKANDVGELYEKLLSIAVESELIMQTI